MSLLPRHFVPTWTSKLPAASVTALPIRIPIVFRFASMASRLFLAAAGLVALCQAFILPSTLPEGYYTISFGLDGTALSQPAPLDTSALPASVRRRQTGNDGPSLPSPRTVCAASSFSVNDFALVDKAMADFCLIDTRYAKSTAVVYTNGNAMAYWCNYDSTDWCRTKEWNEAMDLLDRSCGVGRSGLVDISTWGKSYGRDVAGADICKG
jgi:hypothetical protein